MRRWSASRCEALPVAARPTLPTPSSIATLRSKWLEQGYADRDPQCWVLKAEPYFDPLRTEPRFRALPKKVGLDK